MLGRAINLAQAEFDYNSGVLALLAVYLARKLDRVFSSYSSSALGWRAARRQASPFSSLARVTLPPKEERKIGLSLYKYIYNIVYHNVDRMCRYWVAIEARVHAGPRTHDRLLTRKLNKKTTRLGGFSFLFSSLIMDNI